MKHVHIVYIYIRIYIYCLKLDSRRKRTYLVVRRGEKTGYVCLNLLFIVALGCWKWNLRVIPLSY